MGASPVAKAAKHGQGYSAMQEVLVWVVKKLAGDFRPRVWCRSLMDGVQVAWQSACPSEILLRIGEIGDVMYRCFGQDAK